MIREKVRSPMKKITSILLLLCLCLSLGTLFVACEEEKEARKYPRPVSQKLSKIEWNAMLEDVNFINVTFSFQSILWSNGKEDSCLVKFDGKKAVVGREVVTNEEVTALRKTYIDTALAILADYDKFTYYKRSDKYVSTEEISYTVTVEGVEAAIAVENVRVKLNAEKLPEEITCEMTQEFEKDGVQKKLEFFEVQFNFYNYRTTVAEFVDPMVNFTPSNVVSVLIHYGIHQYTLQPDELSTFLSLFNKLEALGYDDSWKGMDGDDRWWLIIELKTGQQIKIDFVPSIRRFILVDGEGYIVENETFYEAMEYIQNIVDLQFKK